MMPTIGTRDTFDARVCFVCRASVPACAGLYHGDLGILTHQGACADAVQGERRDYGQSTKGRMVPAREVLRRLCARPRLVNAMSGGSPSGSSG